MNTAICTLFEGHYHFGVASLSNSLFEKGYRGTIYIGYRGELPPWALKGERESIGKWGEAITLIPAEGLKLCFLLLDTDYSLTNYKPQFMLDLWQDVAKDADTLYYFDPDITVNEPWMCFEQWVDCGIAVCEDINSPIPKNHPLRVGWRHYYKKYNIDLKFKSDIYVNGGFIGISKKDKSFLDIWVKLQEHMGDMIGGLQKSIFSTVTYNSGIPRIDGFQLFAKSDQDALNACLEVFDGDISFIGKEAMGFVNGTVLMFHALGIPKPWKTHILSRVFSGKPPRSIDVEYWKYAKYPITTYSKSKYVKKRISIVFAKLLGRFYKI